MKQKIFKNWSFYLLFFLVVCGLALLFEKKVVSAGAQIQKTAPDFSLKDLAGHKYRLSDFRGRIVFLNFWASWCPPCRAEAPSIEKLQNTFSKDKLLVVTVATNSSEKQLKNFIKENKLTFLVLTDPSGVVTRLYEIKGVPTTFVLNQKGAILRQELGGRDWAEVGEINYFKKLTGQK